ncbi:Uncharacterised protein [Leclercia adecarboxylata]|uniref:Uncharacterized protein n=1 Tax=Leclercia adecarboxylata TaxID=83655 RepID=A0A4U9HRQ0_9ENTR|nr:Uncharacterised protein [Leclercia adecarboxylata]
MVRKRSKRVITAITGVSPEFAQALEKGDMRVTGWDAQGEIRAVELVTHPFFVATLFQHERAALAGRPAPAGAGSASRRAEVLKAGLAGGDLPIASGKDPTDGHYH